MTHRTETAIIAELAVLLSRRNRDMTLGIVADHARALVALGRRARRHAERMRSDATYCNRRGISDPETGHDLVAPKIQKAAQAIADHYGLEARVSGDPRGFCLYLTGAGMPGNTWGGDSYGYGV